MEGKLQKETKEISSRETQKVLNNRAASETNPAQEKSVGQSLPLNIDFDREIKRAVALCFDQDGHMYVSTFTGAVYAVQLHFNSISIKGTVTSSLQLRSTLLYGIVSLKNVVYVSAHDDNGGIYKLNFNHDNCGLAEKIVSNGGSLCNKVHSVTTYNDDSFAFSDTGGLVHQGL